MYENHEMRLIMFWMDMNNETNSTFIKRINQGHKVVYLFSD